MRSTLGAAALVVVVASTAAPAAQGAQPVAVTGAWSGTLTIKHDGKSDEGFVHVVLKQNGETLTGTAGPDADNQYRISKGKATVTAGVTTIAFEFIANGVHAAFSLMLVDGRLTGEVRVEGEDGQPQTATVELKAVKRQGI